LPEKEQPILFVRSLLVAAALVVGAPLPAWSWGPTAHRLICELAWDEFKPATEVRVSALLGVMSRAQFAAGCAKPVDTSRYVVNVTEDTRAIDLERHCPTTCAIREIENLEAVLKGDASEPRKAEALRHLTVAVAELHQPLTVGFAKDRHGADISAVFLGRESDMAQIWDTELVDEPMPPRARDTAFDLRAITNFLDRSRWVQSGPLEWANESLWIVRTPATGYLGNPGGLAFDEVYVSQNKPVAMDQIEKAGVRLGHRLNRIFAGIDESPLAPPLLAY
jgi:hypothetical protein